MSGDVTYWLVWVVGAVVLAFCLGITWWGLFGDRSRGRRRCPRCWYDLSFSPGLVCAECGHLVNGERQLYRARRRLMPALLAAVVASVGMTFFIERGQSRGWASLVPSRVMIVSLPIFGGSHDALSTELTTRVGRATLTEGQLRIRRAVFRGPARSSHHPIFF